jgi:sulfur carrier protein ThiS
MTSSAGAPSGMTFTITVDGDPLEVTEHELTPNQIMKRVGLDTATHYLVVIEGRNRVSYKDRADEAIRIHENLKIVSVFTGETPVS